ncbi:hypothetical protein HAX54_035630 [Datura stramonium]|uniref:Bet v I/Major latex protein domain-containing protein n=1 Tax=Datura stramonium TaxID=4076 RepID=A0ABS8VIZ0_DATST|nr:hypothetical protein [Datura stramonium]
MGVQGKLTASTGVKCGGHLIYDIFHFNPHHVPNISPSKVKSFEIHQGGTIKTGSIVSWNYYIDGKEKIDKQVIEAIDPKKKSITWKMIEGGVLEFYNSFTAIISCENQRITWTFVYEKKTTAIPDPLGLLDFLIELTHDIEGHFLKK